MIYILMICGICIDQFTKYLARKGLRDAININYFLELKLVENRGVAFSFLEGADRFILILNIVIMVGVLFFLIKGKALSRVSKLGFAMIASGGIGNIIDRAIFGYVTDMISLKFFPAIFNIADIFVTVGVFLILLDMLVLEKGEKNG